MTRKQLREAGPREANRRPAAGSRGPRARGSLGRGEASGAHGAAHVKADLEGDRSTPSSGPPGSSPAAGPERPDPSPKPRPRRGLAGAARPEREGPPSAGAGSSELVAADSAGRGHFSRSPHARPPLPDPLGASASPRDPPLWSQGPIVAPRLTRPPGAAGPGACAPTAGAPGDSRSATGGPEPGGLRARRWALSHGAGGRQGSLSRGPRLPYPDSSEERVSW